MTLTIDQQAFRDRLTAIDNGLKKEKILDSNLQVISRKSWYFRRTGELFSPREGRDLSQVVRKLFEYCKANQEWIDNEDCRYKLLSIFNHLEAKAKPEFKKPVNECLYRSLRLFSPLPNRLVWPADLATIGVSKEQRKKLDDFFHEMTLKPGRKRITFHKEEGKRVLSCQIAEVAYPVELDFSLWLVADRVFLLGKRVIAEGGERKIKVAYDLTTGRLFVKKRISSLEEKIIEGLNDPAIERLIRNTEEKIHCLEEWCPGDLAIYLPQLKKSSTEEKLHLIYSLLNGIKKIQNLLIERTPVESTVDEEEIPCVVYGAFHADIHPYNILPLREKQRLVLIDFGVSGKLDQVSGLVGYRPPEVVQFMRRKMLGKPPTKKDHFDFNLRTGRARDIWEAGLIMADLIIPSCKKTISPFECIDQYINRKNLDPGLPMLTQKEVDREITSLKAKENDFLLKQVWELIALMVKVDPDDRIEIIEALQILDDIMKSK